MSFFNNLSMLFNSKRQSLQMPSKKKQSPTNKTIVKQIVSNQHSNNQSYGFNLSATNSITEQKNKNQTALSPASPARWPNFQVSEEAAQKAESILREAQAKAREIIVEAKDEALAIKARSEKERKKTEKELAEQQRFLQSKIDRLDHRLEQIEQKEEQISRDKQQVEMLRQSLEAYKLKILAKLEQISKTTQSEAKNLLLESVSQKIGNELAQMVRQKQEEAKQEADEKVREILIDSMKNGATDYVSEYTVSVINLPSEDVKGKIIGRSGRNIYAFERATGVDIDLDSSPTEVKLSSFDPIRREIAKIALERLIKDGRIQPSRIEEVVAKVEEDVDKMIFEAGKKLCHTVGIYNLPTGLIKILGRFKYRFSYGQNMITHTIEETKIGTKIAHELGVDVNVVKLGCLLHDIGKVSEETEGNHVELGVKIAKKFNMPQSVIDCIAQHHEDQPFSGPEQMIVYIADAISGARPGARYENFDEYVKRLEQLEAIATSYDCVKQAFAVQAGREVRVLLDPEQSRDDDVEVLAFKIKDEIQTKVTVPGTVRVTVIREKRAESFAN